MNKKPMQNADDRCTKFQIAGMYNPQSPFANADRKPAWDKQNANQSLTNWCQIQQDKSQQTR